MSGGLKAIIAGGVACGPKAASRLKRLMPDAEVIMVEKDTLISYGACGLPYYVSGEVQRIEELMETPMGVQRTPAFFEKVKGFKTLTETEVIKISRDEKTVAVSHLTSREEEILSYDKLILAIGGEPVSPPISGVQLNGVVHLHHPNEAVMVRGKVEQGEVRNAVIIGAGLIGVEMAESLTKKGVKVTVVEMLDCVLGALLDREMGLLAAKHLIAAGVDLVLGETVQEILNDGNGNVCGVKTDSRRLNADFVILAVGVRSSSRVAKDAELDLDSRGHIIVNEFCQTSDPDIYAGGDCVSNYSAIHGTDERLFTPQGSTANKHGRIIANHIAGITEPFPGVLGTVICKAFDITIARTGITERKARSLKHDVETVLWAGADLPHFYPGGKNFCTKLVVDKKDRRILGFQAVGHGDVSKRLDVAATSINLKATIDQLAHLDLGYAPPYSPPIDPIHAAAHVMQNKIDGITRGVSPLELKKMIDDGQNDFVLLDVRSAEEYEDMRLPYEECTINIPLGALREKLASLPGNKRIITLCKVSLRGYEAERILSGEGFKDVSFLEGGIFGWPFEVRVNRQV
ncbi:MAG: FAD-dependent oxidoreductase [Thermodesulfobacteriota bacterium]|nr:FAD-dependent oxidoreductase [Thermodesulfobacteriota bacterium]